MIECMHDLAHHIENILEELPHNLSHPRKTQFSDMLTTLKLEKEKKRCCDWRKMLLVLTQTLYGKIHKLLNTLSEIQRILYLGDDFRTPQEILRLHNSCFEHFILSKEVFKMPRLSAGMTRDKPFGKYAHNLLVHAPIRYRIIRGESINAEQEERTFNTIQSITKGKTNNIPGHLIGNMIVRHEYKTINKILYEFEQAESSTIKEINVLGENLVKLQNNSLFTYNYIQNNSADWQSHLQRISEFLILENIWWQKTEIGIEFFDCDKPLRIEQNPKVHHFRSASIDNVLSDLEQHWSNITRNNICIPT